MSFTLEQKLDRLSLLSGMDWLDGMYCSRENDETKRELVDVLYKRHEAEIIDRISAGEKLLKNDKVHKTMRELYQNGGAEKGLNPTNYWNLRSRLPSFVEIDNCAKDSGWQDKFVRINARGLRYFVYLYEATLETMKKETEISESEIVPKKFEKVTEMKEEPEEEPEEESEESEESEDSDEEELEGEDSF